MQQIKIYLSGETFVMYQPLSYVSHVQNLFLHKLKAFPRLEYLKEDHGKLSKSDIEIIRRDLPDYFKKNLNQNIFCYLIREKEEGACGL